VDLTADDHPDVSCIVELGMQAPDYVAIMTAADGVSSDFTETAEAVDAAVPTLFIARDDWADDARLGGCAHAAGELRHDAHPYGLRE
jgi:hypothetical protein